MPSRGAGGGGRVRKHDGVAVAHQTRAVGELCHFAGFDRQIAAGEVVAECSVMFKHGNFVLSFFFRGQNRHGCTV